MAPELLGSRSDTLELICYVYPKSFLLIFSDGKSGTWTFEELGLDMKLDMNRVRPETVKLSDIGDIALINSKGIFPQTIVLDVETMRCNIDDIDNKSN